MATCSHAGEAKVLKPGARVCEKCQAAGAPWVQLRMCMSCGHVGSCDSSKNRHATAHFRETAHPVMRSIEPGQGWKWCYVHEAMID